MLLSLMLSTQDTKENFNTKDEDDKRCRKSLVVAIMVIEFFLMVWAITLAIRCPDKNDWFHLTFAAILPMWYLIMYYWGGWCPSGQR